MLLSVAVLKANSLPLKKVEFARVMAVFPLSVPTHLHLLPALLCVFVSRDEWRWKTHLMRVPEVPGVGDDFLTLVNPHGGCGARCWCDTPRPLSLLWTEPEKMATLCISEHVVSLPVTSRAESCLCSLICLYPLLCRRNELPVSCDWF